MNITFDLTHLNDLNMLKINERDKLSLERVLDFDELDAVVKQLKNGKAAGTDGWPIQYYKMFWPKISNLLHYVILEV